MSMILCIVLGAINIGMQNRNIIQGIWTNLVLTNKDILLTVHLIPSLVRKRWCNFARGIYHVYRYE